jgi:hypothetical protein
MFMPAGSVNRGRTKRGGALCPKLRLLDSLWCVPQQSCVPLRRRLPVAPLVRGVGHARRKLLVALAGLAVVVAAGVVVFCILVVVQPAEPTRVTLKNAARIKPGMTLKSVEAILGPAGDYSTQPMLAVTFPGGWGMERSSTPGRATKWRLG